MALISVTPQGLELAKQLKKKLGSDPTILKVDIFHKNVKKTIKEVFREYDAIISIMASGIMVRNICGLLKNKKHDPAVVVVDDAGRNVISLLSGHMGGGNDLTLKIAKLINANPVITTSTDVHGYMGIDTLARKYYWDIKDTEKIVKFNKAILSGRRIKIATFHDVKYLYEDPLFKKSYKLVKTRDRSKAILDNDELTIKPLRIVAGIGTKRGVEEDDIIRGLERAFSFLDLPLQRLDAMATGEMKKDEKGIINVSKILNIPLKIVKLDDLKKERTYSRSDFVEDKFGVASVCEAAALHVAGEGARIIIRKTTYNGIAIAVAAS